MDLMDGMDPEGEAPHLMRATGSSPLSFHLSRFRRSPKREGEAPRLDRNI
jgi:hypothetical protein